YHDVAPIIQNRCATCHRPGEAGPFPLLTYEDVRKRASLIAKVTHSRFMPPWLPEPGYGEFADERRLSESEIQTIAKWVEAGCVEGKSSGAPSKQWNEGWQLGQPDLIVQMPPGYTLPAGGTDVYRNFVLPPVIDIPAGEKNYLVESSYVLPVDVEAVSILPHAHYLGHEMAGNATLPDGATRPLILIRNWDFNWQGDYRYAKPISLPKGT